MLAERLGRNLAAGFAVVALTYVVAGVAAWLVVAAHPSPHPLLVTFYADLVATVVVFAVSTVVANASLYDPYWSVAPAVIVVAWVLWRSGSDLSVRQVFVVLFMLVWAVRLTANWASGWQGLRHEDWRYVQVREERPPCRLFTTTAPRTRVLT